MGDLRARPYGCPVWQGRASVGSFAEAIRE